MENVSCDFCKNVNSTKITEQTDVYHQTTNELFSIVKCTNCELMYTNPRPDENEIGKYYSSKYNFHSSKSKLTLLLLEIAEYLANAKFAALFNAIPFINKKLVTYVKPSIEDPIKKMASDYKTFLDIGCGSGISAHFWGTKGALLNYRKHLDVYGVEISDEARQVLSSKGVQSFKTIHDVPADQEFDLIRMNWSLEHVHSPSLFFGFIKKHLSPQGKAIILIPNTGGLLYKIAINSVELPIHLYHFTKNDIVNYTEKNNLAIAQHETFSYPQMYRFLSFVNPSLSGVFNDLKIKEACSFQKTLSRFDKLGLGNDMLFVLEHKS